MQVSIGASLSDVYDAARAKHAALPERASVRGAINLEFADWEARIADGDEVAFIPPVSGGNSSPRSGEVAREAGRRGW